MANIIEIIIKAIDQTGTGTSGALGNLGKIGATASRIGLGLTVGLTAPIVGAGLASISMASDMEESLSKVNVVFGDNADEIEEWASSTASNLGISKQAALEAAGTFGNLFSAMGVATDPAAEMSQDLVNLAADLASFNNIDPTVALEKLRAGITGESEPLKSLGVLLTVAAVEAKALELGLVDANGEISSANLVTARYALIMEQTTLAQGDFARTSDGLANSTRVMKAELADASAELGVVLLPIALKVVQAITALVEKFTNMSPAGQKVVLVVGAILAALGPVLMIVGSVISTFATLAGLFGAGGALAGVGAAFSAAFLPVLGVLAAVVSFIAPPIIALNSLRLAIGFLQDKFPGLATAWSTMWEAIKTKIAEAWETVKAKFTEIVDGIKAKFTDVDWGALGTAIIDGIKAGVSSAVQGLIDAVGAAAQSAIDKAKALLGIGSPSKVFAEVGLNMMQGWAAGIRGGLPGPVGAVERTTTNLLGAAPASAFTGSGGISVPIYATINNGMDLERVAERVAERIQRRGPRA